MGLASDSLVMTAVGNRVTALESQEVIFQVVSRGLATYQTDDTRRIWMKGQLTTIHINKRQSIFI